MEDYAAYVAEPRFWQADADPAPLLLIINEEVTELNCLGKPVHGRVLFAEEATSSKAALTHLGTFWLLMAKWRFPAIRCFDLLTIFMVLKYHCLEFHRITESQPGLR